MRQVLFALGFGKRYILTVVTIAMLASPAWATVDYKRYDTREADEKRLKAVGWTTTFQRDLQTSAWPDKVVLQRTANELVGRSVHALPEVVAAQISSEVKHEIARLTREALVKASLEEREIVTTGRMGSLLYKVGALQYYHFKYTQYGNKKFSPGGLSPFVALMPAGQARLMEAQITVELHWAHSDAKIFFDGEPTTQTGMDRVFVTPVLEVGKSYQYELVIRWQEDGKEVKQSRKVTVAGGDSVRVDFKTQRGDRIACKWTPHTGGRKTAEDCSFAYSPDRKTVVKVLDKGADPGHKSIRLYDTATDRALGPKIVLDGQRITALAVSPDGKTLASAAADFRGPSYVKLWDVATGNEIILPR